MWSSPALAADDASLGRSLQEQVCDRLDCRLSLYPLDVVREHLGPDQPRLLITGAAMAGDVPRVVELVREVRLRQWPVTAVVVSAKGLSNHPALTGLDRFLACRLNWPDETATLLDFVHFHHLLRRPGRGARGHPTDGGRSRAWQAGRRPHRDDNGPWPEEMEFLTSLCHGVERAQTDTRAHRRLLAETPSLAPLLEPLALAAAHDVTVLVTGETGTGKTHVARYIHEHSKRRSERLLVVPCGALSPALVDTEFFGHVKGAFTGADQAKIGKFEAAGAGTLLLDEIDTLGLEQQAKLLRVIETGEFEPVGSNETRRCQARVIAASNIDLAQAVQAGRFRQDLYYRLNVLSLYLPPLRERVQDIAALARGMALRFSTKFRKPLFRITPEAQAVLEEFAWPGNIRQLENVVQQAVLLSDGLELQPHHVLPMLRTANPPPTCAGGLFDKFRQQERTAIEQALIDCGQCRSRAARSLGISRATLYNKLKKYDLLRMADLSSPNA
jgi:DNA-binding NtrC family response regulator